MRIDVKMSPNDTSVYLDDPFRPASGLSTKMEEWRWETDHTTWWDPPGNPRYFLITETIFPNLGFSMVLMVLASRLE